MTQNRAATLVAAIGLLLAPYPSVAQDWQGPATLAVRVTNGDGEPIPEAKVLARLAEGDPNAGPTAVNTNSGGSAIVAGLAEGEWFVEVSHPGYMLYAAYVDLRAGKKPQVGFSSQVNTETSWTPMTVKFAKASPAFNRGSGRKRAEPEPPEVVREAPPPRQPAPPAVVRPTAEPKTPTTPTVVRPEPQPSTPDSSEAAGSQAPETPAEESPLESAEETPAAEVSAAPLPTPESPSLEPQEPVDESATREVLEAPPTLTSPPSETLDVPPSPALEEAAAEQEVPPLAPQPQPVVAPEPEIETAVEAAEVVAPAPVEAPAPEAAAAEVIVEATEAPAEPRMALPSPQQDPPTPAEPVQEPAPAPAVDELPAPVEEEVAEEIVEPAPSEPTSPLPEAPSEPAVEEPTTEAPAAVTPSPETPIAETSSAVAPSLSERDAAPPSVPETSAPAPQVGRIPRYLRSASAGSCSECEPGEWAVASEQAAARAADATAARQCVESFQATTREAVQLLADAPADRLDNYAGPALTAMFRMPPSGDRDRLQQLLGPVTDPESYCQLAGVVLPRSAAFSGYVLEAWDSLGGRTCRGDISCAVGKARWLSEPTVVEGAERLVVYGIFKNSSTRRERRARMTIYFQPPSTDWRPTGR